METTRRAAGTSPPGSTVGKYGILLVPVALALAMLCFGSLNSVWLLFYCAGSFVFSIASLWALKRAEGPARHFATIILGTTACLSLGAAILRLTSQT